MLTTRNRPSIDAWLPGLVLFLVVLVACVIGIVTRPLGSLAALWPANALLLGLLVRYPRLSSPAGWTGAIIGYYVADLAAGGALLATTILTAGNLAGVVTGHLLFLRLGESQRRLEQPLSILQLTLIAAAASSAAGAVGAVADPLLFAGTPMSGFTFWAIAEMCNYVAILPMVLTLPEISPSWLKRNHPRHHLKAVLPLIALALSCACGAIIGGPGILAFPLPALLWCALRYSVFATAVLTFFFCGFVLIAVAQGYAFIPVMDANSRATLLSLRLGVMLMALSPIAVASVMSARNALLHRLQHLAAHDALTGLLNRRAFYDRATIALATQGQRLLPATVLMLDIDDFKHINDGYGHAAGDRVLKRFADVATQCVSGTDILGRLGGEEFGILLPNLGLADAEAVAQTIRRQFDEVVLEAEDGTEITATVSIGMAHTEEAGMPLDRLLGIADQALYRAKSSGRNRLEWARAEPAG